MNKVIDKNDLPDIILALEGFNSYEVEVGILGGGKGDERVGNTGITMLELAQILHDGCRIKVTPKMRAFLAAKGLYLKKSTQYITIPPRPFIDPVVPVAEAFAAQFFEAALKQAIDAPRDFSPQAKWEQLGLELTGLIKKEMVDLRNPPNHPFTIAMKGSDNPLIDHGHLLRSVEYVVRWA